MTTLAPRVVVVTRPSAYRELLDRHGTPGAVEYFLRHRAAGDLADLRVRDAAWTEALALVHAAIPAGWRTGRADRAELAAFPFADDDIVVSVGPDGLVANVAKYLDAQPVIGVDPAGPGALARYRPEDVAGVLRGGITEVEERVTVVAELDDGQWMRGLNEVFVGDPGHQSARYLLRTPDGRSELQSSSGLLVGTGTGATGWCASMARALADPPRLPSPVEPALCWFVREAWPSPTTGVDFVAGRLAADEHLELTVGSDRLVVFSDGGETDRLVARRGQRVTIGLAQQRLCLVSAASTTSGPGVANGAPPSRRARRR